MFGTPAFSTALTIFTPSAASMESGFSHMIILPAFAAGPGQKVLIAAIGAGFTWGAGVIEWGVS